MGYMDWLEKNYYKYRKYIPGRLLYDSEHFAVRRALALTASQQVSLIDDQLRDIISLAIRHVPHYRNAVRLSEKEVANEAPRDLLARFPYLEKDEIMSRQKDFLDERLNPKRLNYVTSGGSTGQGIGLWRTKRIGDIEKAFFVNEWGKFGFSFDKSRYLRGATRSGSGNGRKGRRSPVHVPHGGRLLRETEGLCLLPQRGPALPAGSRSTSRPFSDASGAGPPGSWHIMGGWYLQPDCNMPSGESFVRQILLGQRYFREKFGVEPTTAVNLDPFGHTRGLVQILAKSGYDSYLFCRPGPDGLPAARRRFPLGRLRRLRGPGHPGLGPLQLGRRQGARARSKTG